MLGNFDLHRVRALAPVLAGVVLLSISACESERANEDDDALVVLLPRDPI
jgi:hypothetical protein